jgi:hypothetical protein
LSQQLSKNAFLANRDTGSENLRWDVYKNAFLAIESENPRAGKECNFNQQISWVRKSSMGVYKELAVSPCYATVQELRV